MTFDDSYSDNVSLSKILDCFLYERETPTVILNFLSKYRPEEILDILMHSSCLPRLFSLDFAYKCSESEYDTLLGYLENEDIPRADESFKRICLYFLWQILRSKIGDGRKERARVLISRLSPSAYRSGFYHVRHPYHGTRGRMMSEYDSLFIEHPENEDGVIRAIGRMDACDFISYVENIWNSLWGMRILQVDVFESFDIQKQYILISRLFQFGRKRTEFFAEDIFRFYRQIMDSKVDVEIKKMLHEHVTSLKLATDYFYTCNQEVHEVLNIKDIVEMVMRMQLFGVDRYAENIIMFFLLDDNRENLKWMYENCKEILVDYLDVTDLVERWIEDEGK